MESQDAAPILTVIEAFVAAWNRHDTEAMAALFAPDADFVNAIGLWWRGRAEIEAGQRRTHATLFKASRVVAGEVHVRFLRPEVALAHWTWELSGMQTREGHDLPPRAGLITLVLARDGAAWPIAAFQNTDIVPPL